MKHIDFVRYISVAAIGLATGYFAPLGPWMSALVGFVAAMLYDNLFVRTYNVFRRRVPQNLETKSANSPQ